LPAIGEDPLDPVAGADLPALLYDVARDLVPHLSGAELGVQELFDQRGLRILLPDVAAAAFEHLPQGVEQRGPDREALDALGAPFGADPVARHAPDLLGVGLEERAVQFPPKRLMKNCSRVSSGLRGNSALCT
jgi:hypothetical protein